MEQARDTAVVLCADAAFLPFAAQLASQIDALCPDRRFDLVIAGMEDLTLPPVLARHGIRVDRLAPGPAIEALPRRRLPAVAYLRMYLCAHYAGRYRRILYLDGDMVFTGGDLDRLLASDLRGRPVAAARSFRQHQDPSALVELFKVTGQGPKRYFNSGVLLFDVAAWNAAGCLARIEAAGAAHPDIWRIAQDQALLNIALTDEIAELHPVWNWPHIGRTALLGYGVPVRFHHFMGRQKPWDGTGGPQQRVFHQTYAEFFARAFPDQAGRVAPLPPHRPPTLLGLAGLLGRSLRLRKSMAAFLARFADEWQVLA